MFVIVAKKMARASRVGPIHAALSRGVPAASSRFDGVARDDRHVDEEPESDDERRDRNLLDVDAEHLHRPERHGDA